MERMGGKEQLLEQMYSAMATQKDETVDLALRSYGALQCLLSHALSTLPRLSACLERCAHPCRSRIHNIVHDVNGPAKEVMLRG